MSNIDYAYNSFNEKFQKSPFYDDFLIQKMNAMAPECSEKFVMLIAAMDNQRIQKGLPKLDVRSVTALADVYTSGFPILNPISKKAHYVDAKDYTEIQNGFKEVYNDAMITGSTIHPAVFKKENLFAEQLKNDVINLKAGEYEMPAEQKEPKECRQGKDMSNRLMGMLHNIFGKEEQREKSNDYVDRDNETR